MITQDGIKTLSRLIKDNILGSRAVVDGKYVESDIHKIETTKNSVKIYTYLDETVVGRITRHEIITKDGYVFLEKADNVTKTDERGLLTMFEITIKEG